MRQIKFKCWNKVKKEWVDDFVISSDGKPGYCDSSAGDWICGCFEEYEDCILVEFTGLQDGNGVEIYEGDILKTNYKNILDTGYVTYEKSKARYYLRDIKSTAYFNQRLKLSNLAKYSEVIGNIHSNPEILGEK